ncbi:hypothetical protein BDR07DRAFT_568888 [Suillus spraguei]|nr:hypothetical protein BDR07DRAFT_568888 [Suillus spraguei]
MVASACAQNAYINLPASGSNITASANSTVQIGLPNNLTSSKEIAIVIAIQSCPTGDCLH